MSDRMVVMKKGRIEEIGDPDQVYQNPGSEYTKQLISSIPKIDIDEIKRMTANKKNLAD